MNNSAAGEDSGRIVVMAQIQSECSVSQDQLVAILPDLHRAKQEHFIEDFWVRCDRSYDLSVVSKNQREAGFTRSLPRLKHVENDSIFYTPQKLTLHSYDTMSHTSKISVTDKAPNQLLQKLNQPRTVSATGRRFALSMDWEANANMPKGPYQDILYIQLQVH